MLTLLLIRICFILLHKPVILDYLASKRISSNDLVVVSPDVGGVARARSFAKKLSDAPLAIVDKRRHGHNVAEVVTLSNHTSNLYQFITLSGYLRTFSITFVQSACNFR